MTFSKITMLATAVAFLSFNGIVIAEERDDSTEVYAGTKRTPEEQKEIDTVLKEFKGLKACDGSKRAETICNKNCTGAGYLWGKGTCSHQEIWNKCAAHCRADLIKDCSETATSTKNNLKGTAKCTQ